MQCAIQNHIFVHLTTEDGHDKTSMLDLSNSEEKNAKLFFNCNQTRHLSLRSARNITGENSVQARHLPRTSARSIIGDRRRPNAASSSPQIRMKHERF